MTMYSLDGKTPVTPEDGDFWVAPGAQVMGNVTLHSGSSVWFNAVIRGDNDLIEIGVGSNVQDGAVLHNDLGFPLIIGNGCTIGHQAVLHGCVIGENSLVGMGATILNGARIGRDSIVGANALVTEGKSFPDGSLIVGAPAKAVRVLDAAAIQGLKASALHYQQNMRRFRDGLKPV
jgi:carbonic anhydrase/acetyltransferase-like protein (isoleucine patch superfamily)